MIQEVVSFYRKVRDCDANDCHIYVQIVSVAGKVGPNINAEMP